MKGIARMVVSSESKWDRSASSNRSSLIAFFLDQRWTATWFFNLTKATWFNQIIGPISPFEIISALFVCVIPTIYSITADKTGSGQATQYMVFITVILALKKNFLEYSLGVSWERAISFHKTFGIISFVCACLHGLPQLQSLSESKCLSGLIILISLGLQPVMYILVKSRSFELFYYSHLAIYCVMIYFAVVHSALFVAWSGIVFLADLFLRFCLRTHRVIASIHVKDGGIVQIKFDKMFSYRPGQYVFLMIPTLGALEFHPFSISSAPGERSISLHISALGGWTQRLAALVVELAHKGTDGGVVNAWVQGPYGIPAVNFEAATYQIVVLISGGIGVTPHQSLANHLLEEHEQGRSLKKLVYVWAVQQSRIGLISSMQKGGQLPKSKSYELGAVDIATSSNTLESDNSVLFMDLYCTNSIRCGDGPLSLALDNFEGAQPTLPVAPKHGRPDFPQLLRQIKALAIAQNECRVAVSVCGPDGMVGSVVEACRQLTSSEVQFDLHVERFRL